MKNEKPYNDIRLLDFQDKFSTKEICWDYLVKMRWPNGVKCSYCADSKLDFIQTRKVFECRQCHRQIYATAGTIFHKSRVPLRKWFWAIYLMATSKKGVSMLYLQNQLELGSYHTAWLIGHKIRQAMSQRDSIYTLGGTVETDEIFIGGKQSLDERRSKGNNKTPFLIAVEENSAHGAKCVRAPIERAGNLVPLSICVVKIHGPHDWPHEPIFLRHSILSSYISRYVPLDPP